MSDLVDVQQALHDPEGVDCHFRFTGTVNGRAFIVNLQFDTVDETSGEKVYPVEHDFLTCKILMMILTHVTKHSNPGLN